MKSITTINNSFEKYLKDGSGWTLNSINRLDICITSYKPMAGSSCGITQFKDSGNKSFLYCIISQIFPNTNKHQRKSYFKKHEKKLNMKKMKYPVSIDDIDVFEKNNPSISVNEFDAQGKTIRLTTHRDRKHQVNMLYFQEQYCLLSNLSRFLPKYKINLPKYLSHHKKGILNINNVENKCFLWCIIAGIKKIYSKDVCKYTEYENEININGIEYPVKVTDLDKFENLNPNISVSVFGYKGEIYPLRISKVKGENI